MYIYMYLEQWTKVRSYNKFIRENNNFPGQSAIIHTINNMSEINIALRLVSNNQIDSRSFIIRKIKLLNKLVARSKVEHSTFEFFIQIWNFLICIFLLKNARFSEIYFRKQRWQKHLYCILLHEPGLHWLYQFSDSFNN